MNADIKVSGPIFRGKVDLRAGTREGLEEVGALGAGIVRRQLAQRTRYRTPKYGHIVDRVRHRFKEFSNGGAGVRIWLAGAGSFLGPILEGGTEAHYLAPRRSKEALSFLYRGTVIQRAYAHHPGSPAYKWRAKSWEELQPQVDAILTRALARHMGA